MDADDKEAQLVLDALADLPRCPGCGQVGSWSMFRGLLEGHCTTVFTKCQIVYFRRDGSYLEMDPHTPGVGPWQAPKV